MRTAAPANAARALTDSVQKFARVRNATIRMVAGLTEEQAAFRPEPEAWSAAQILDHLLLTEAINRRQYHRMLDMAREGKRLHLDVGINEVQFNLPFIPKALMPMMTLPLTMMNMFVPPALREAALRTPVMKVKSPRISEPAPSKPVAVLREQLAASLAETEALFAGPLPANAYRVTVTHPIFGRNTLAGVIRLMAAHEERHGTQLAGVLRHPRFPATPRFV